jgi:beta-glucanase (GH16 family)
MLDRPEDFHTYVMEWTNETITVSYDGKVCLVPSSMYVDYVRVWS